MKKFLLLMVMGLMGSNGFTTQNNGLLGTQNSPYTPQQNPFDDSDITAAQSPLDLNQSTSEPTTTVNNFQSHHPNNSSSQLEKNIVNEVQSTPQTFQQSEMNFPIPPQSSWETVCNQWNSWVDDKKNQLTQNYQQFKQNPKKAIKDLVSNRWDNHYVRALIVYWLCKLFDGLKFQASLIAATCALPEALNCARNEIWLWQDMKGVPTSVAVSGVFIGLANLLQIFNPLPLTLFYAAPFMLLGFDPAREVLAWVEQSSIFQTIFPYLITGVCPYICNWPKKAYAASVLFSILHGLNVLHQRVDDSLLQKIGDIGTSLYHRGLDFGLIFLTFSHIIRPYLLGPVIQFGISKGWDLALSQSPLGIGWKACTGFLSQFIGKLPLF